MSRLLKYGPHEIRVSDNQDLDALLDRIQEVVNGGKAEWVQIDAEREPHRILVQPGIPVYVPGKGRTGGGQIL